LSDYISLSDPNLTAEGVQSVWSNRRSRMKQRRMYYETLWRSALTNFYIGIFPDSAVGAKPLYNPIYEQYDMSLYSKDGFRFLRMRLPMMHSIVIRKMAAEMPNRPKVNFVAMGDNDPAKAVAFKHWFAQFLYDMDADQEDFETFLWKDILGTAAVMVITKEYDVTVKDENGTRETRTKKRTEYKSIDLRRLWLDEHCQKSNLEDCNYCQIDEYLSKDEALQVYSNKEKYNQEVLSKAVEITMETDDGDTNYGDLFGLQEVQFVRVTHCFDKIHDCYHVLINDLVINTDLQNPIPRMAKATGKDLPIALAVDFKMPGSPYGYSSAHVSAIFFRIKNLIRQILFEVTEKQAKPLLAVDPLSGFDEETFEWGQEFMRIKPGDVSPIQINFDTNTLYNMDKTTDNDVISATGINFNDTTNMDAGETARKTIIRRESQNAIVEMGMNYNSSVYFKRLYELLKDEILYQWRDQIGKSLRVRTKNVQIGRNKKGELVEDDQAINGFRYFDLKRNDLAEDYELYLELANMASSKELEKAIVAEQLQAIAPFLQTFDAQGLATYLKDTFVMPDSVLPQSKESSQSPEEIAKENIPPEFLPQLEQQKLSEMAPVPNQPPNAPMV